jgi:hypothetical protein
MLRPTREYLNMNFVGMNDYYWRRHPSRDIQAFKWRVMMVTWSSSSRPSQTFVASVGERRSRRSITWLNNSYDRLRGCSEPISNSQSAALWSIKPSIISWATWSQTQAPKEPQLRSNWRPQVERSDPGNTFYVSLKQLSGIRFAISNK